MILVFFTIVFYAYSLVDDENLPPWDGKKNGCAQMYRHGHAKCKHSACPASLCL